MQRAAPLSRGLEVLGSAGYSKLAGFDAQTAAFFDELSNIRDEVRKSRDDGIERDTQRPYTGILTMGEEVPFTEYWRSPLQYNDEPEVILGRRIG